MVFSLSRCAAHRHPGDAAPRRSLPLSRQAKKSRPARVPSLPSSPVQTGDPCLSSCRAMPRRNHRGHRPPPAGRSRVQHTRIQLPAFPPSPSFRLLFPPNPPTPSREGRADPPLSPLPPRPSQKLLLLAPADRADDSGVCWPAFIAYLSPRHPGGDSRVACEKRGFRCARAARLTAVPAVSAPALIFRLQPNFPSPPNLRKGLP